MSTDSRKIRLILELRHGGIVDRRTLAAIERVPREIFVPDAFKDKAYDNVALPIGHEQTISMPMEVAQMTQALEVGDRMKVLEIGTGSGYQAAVLAEVLGAGHVYTVEVVRALGEAARKRLKDLGYDNVTQRIGDGYKGWPAEAPFDGVLVTAAPPKIPQALIDQLRPGGRMVVPVGRAHDRQTLSVVTKDASGHVSVDQILPVAFVPMVPGRDTLLN
ncbi:MAG: protein-L-isoaspartate(D-aspartate) O-methyltransferase [Proteobacteria bacterium]|nr:protein-L-isoaspartate(D-aspartate) O-methyltransferase [Pseudomonadota bacterium]